MSGVNGKPLRVSRQGRDSSSQGMIGVFIRMTGTSVFIGKKWGGELRFEV
jgi:hypothetical protein